MLSESFDTPLRKAFDVDMTNFVWFSKNSDVIVVTFFGPLGESSCVVTTSKYRTHVCFPFQTSNLHMCWNIQFEDSTDNSRYTMSVQRQFQELDPLWLTECPEDETMLVDRVDITSGVLK